VYVRTARAVLPQIMDGELRRVRRGVHIHSEHPAIRLLQLPLLIELIREELVLVLCDAGVDEDGVNATKACVGSFEG